MFILKFNNNNVNNTIIYIYILCIHNTIVMRYFILNQINKFMPRQGRRNSVRKISTNHRT